MKEVLVVVTKREFIEPPSAKKYLERNLQNNRRISMRNVMNYARDMKNDDWPENGESIKFDKDGNLIDGQHRLLACIEAGVGFWTNVARNVDPKAFITIDRHQSRSIGQQLFLETGIGEYNNTASALRWLYCFDNGVLHPKKNASLTAHETFDMLGKHPDIVENILMAGTFERTFKLGPRSLVGVLLYLFKKQDKEKAEKFFDAVVHGEDLRRNDPAFKLRESIMKRRPRSNPMTQYEVAALCFKAWQAEKEGRTIEEFRWRPGEAFPSIGPVTGFKSISRFKQNLPKRPVQKSKQGDVVKLLSKKVSIDNKVSNK